MLRLPFRFAAVILTFVPLFSHRSWRQAEVLLIGAILALGKRAVSSILRIVGLQRERRFGNYHRVLNRAAWSPRAASRLLLGLLIEAFAPDGPVVLGIHDTIERRRGTRIGTNRPYRPLGRGLSRPLLGHRDTRARPAEAGRRLRIGAFGAFESIPVEPKVTAAFAASCAVLRDLGHDVEEIEPLWDAEEVGALFGALASVGVARVVAGIAGIAGWQERVTPAIRQQAEAGASKMAAEYVTDLDRLTAFRFALQDAIAGFDAVATPSSPALPWPRTDPYPKTIAGREAVPRDAVVFTTAVNLAGLPAIVVPAPVTGLPVGLQLIGPIQSEERLIDLAAEFEAARP